MELIAPRVNGGGEAVEVVVSVAVGVAAGVSGALHAIERVAGKVDNEKTSGHTTGAAN